MAGVGRLNGLVIDGADTIGLARFWSAIFDTRIDSTEGDGHYVDLAATDGAPTLRFQRVPEAKTVKNRLHLDVEVDDVGDAVERVRALGGSLVGEERTEYGWAYVVVADLEGNEFCLIRRSDG